MRPFTYSRPDTAAEAVQAVADGGEGTRFLAGGTTLYDLMKLDVETPSAIVDLSRLDELRRFDTSRRREMVFGALASMDDVANDPRLVREYPALAESLSGAASQQLRNMASVGGNLLQRTRCPYFRGGEPYACNKREPGSGCAAIEGLNRSHAVLGTSDDCIATYPGDWAVALAAFDAQIDTLSPRGRRTIPLLDLHRPPGRTPNIETVLGRDELIVSVRVPKTRAGRASTYHKVRDRESFAFALASAAVALRLDGGGRVREARVALGGVATTPWRSRRAERALVGRRLTRSVADDAGEAAYTGARTRRDNEYKRELGARTVSDALMIAMERAG